MDDGDKSGNNVLDAWICQTSEFAIPIEPRLRLCRNCGY